MFAHKNNFYNFISSKKQNINVKPKTIIMKTKFKSTRPINVKTDRGIDLINTVGEVQKIEGNRVYLKGLMYDFSISKSSFEKYNKY